MDYHGIVIDISVKDPAVLEQLGIIGKKTTSKWTLLKVSVPQERIDSIIRDVKRNLHEKYYAHFYRGNELIVVYPDAVFRATPDKETWREAVAHGKALDIPDNELDFFPCRAEDETY